MMTTAAGATSSTSFERIAQTSESPAASWGQPAASHYEIHVHGRLIKGVLITSLDGWSSGDLEIEAELRAWDALSDEALRNLESTME